MFVDNVREVIEATCFTPLVSSKQPVIIGFEKFILIPILFKIGFKKLLHKSII